MLKRLFPLRGGNWNNGVRSGLFNLNLNNVVSYANNNIGFRSAFGKSQILHFQGIVIRAISKGILALADKFVSVIETTAKQIETSKSGVVILDWMKLPVEIVQ